MTSDFLPGFALGFSLILAIGAQNAFVLRQGLRKEHVFWICLTCAASDAALIAAGVTGIGAITRMLPWFEPAMRYGGAAFLTWYGARSLLSAWRGGSALDTGQAEGASLRRSLLIVLALTWLNPHVYLDTVLLIGSISSQYDDRLSFALGAMTASFVFFFSLGYGASLLAPLFARPTAWRILDLIIGIVMWAIALKLLLM